MAIVTASDLLRLKLVFVQSAPCPLIPVAGHRCALREEKEGFTVTLLYGYKVMF